MANSKQTNNEDYLFKAVYYIMDPNKEKRPRLTRITLRSCYIEGASKSTVIGTPIWHSLAKIALFETI